VAETTALGAAYLAGLAAGFWEDRRDIARQWQVDRRFAPGMRPAPRKALIQGWEKALGRSKAWAAEE
jgi:glycerol kinase